MIQRVPFVIQLQLTRTGMADLKGIHMPNPDGQPLILHPGFTQNGHVYDLIPGQISLAEYLWSKGYDIWIIHQRGTGDSGDKRRPFTMDDMASDDVPQIIQYVVRRTNKKPILIGHSEGGNVSLLSMMGVTVTPNGSGFISQNASNERQAAIRGLVTMGSFPNFSGKATIWMRELLEQGVTLPWWLFKIHLSPHAGIIGLKTFFLLPYFRSLRDYTFFEGRYSPIAWIVNFSMWLLGKFPLVSELYVHSNVSAEAARALSYRTVDGTSEGILMQIVLIARNQTALSASGRVDYSLSFGNIRLPVATVTMQFCKYADPERARLDMFDHFYSTQKTFYEWKGLGHEDHFMNPKYFDLVLKAINAVE